MNIEPEKLKQLSEVYGDAFYLLDSAQFKLNIDEINQAFKRIYPNFNIAYSYKTNYIPELCKIVDKCDGYAEIVSDMELEIAYRIGVRPEKIIWNGPYKNIAKTEELLLLGGTVNMDSICELKQIKKIAAKHPNNTLNIGIRVNFEINDNITSRFGFAVETQDFLEAVKFVKETSNVHLKSMQLHYASRRLDTWKPRAKGMLQVIRQYDLHPDTIDLGGGLFGKMDESLKIQFDSEVPTYKQYAEEIAPIFVEYYHDASDNNKPLLLIEPGSAIVGDCMKFACKVINIKTVRNKNIATIAGSIYNINPTLNKKNPPISIYRMGGKENTYNSIDFGGYTCIESDYVYKNYCGSLAVGDFTVFGNAGSYSVTLKPPFILPNFPILDISGREVVVAKRQEYFDDLFHTYKF